MMWRGLDDSNNNRRSVNSGGEQVEKMKPKYNNVITEVDGIKFRSKKEAMYYQDLKVKVEQGVVTFFLRQVPFYLPGGVKYVADFVEFLEFEQETSGDNFYQVEFIDVKGMKTATYKMKKKMVEALYPIKIVEK